MSAPAFVVGPTLLREPPKTPLGPAIVELWFKPPPPRVPPAALAILREVSEAAQLAAPVLEAKDRTDVRDQLEALLQSPAFAEMTGRASQLVETLPDNALDLLLGAPVPPWLIAVFGAGPSRIIQQSLIDARHLFIAAKRLAAVTVIGESRTTEPVDPLDFVNNPNLHPTIVRALLEGLMASAGQLVMIEATKRGTKLEPWHAQAIAEAIAHGTREYLRFLASLPEARVPDDAVPMSDRYDLLALQNEVYTVNARMRGWMRIAKANGGSFFPHGPRIDHDDE